MLLQPVCDIAGNEKGNRNERFYRYGVAHCTCFLFAEKGIKLWLETIMQKEKNTLVNLRKLPFP